MKRCSKFALWQQIDPIAIAYATGTPADIAQSVLSSVKLLLFSDFDNATSGSIYLTGSYA